MKIVFPICILLIRGFFEDLEDRDNKYQNFILLKEIFVILNLIRKKFFRKTFQNWSIAKISSGKHFKIGQSQTVRFFVEKVFAIFQSNFLSL